MSGRAPAEAAFRRVSWSKGVRPDLAGSELPALRARDAKAVSSRVPGAGERRRDRLVDLVVAGVLALAAFALYLRTMAPGLLGGDSGEFQFAAWLGGFVHPTGYPLYLLLGFIWSHLLDVQTPAWRMNAFSALWGAITVGLTYLLATRVLSAVTLRSRMRQASSELAVGDVARRVAGAVIALTFAVSPTFWSQSTVAEVYTLHTAFFVAVLVGLLIWAEQPRPPTSYRALYWTALVYGIGLTHHRTMLLLAPAVALYLWLGRRGDETWGKRIGGMGRIVLCLLLPSLLYLLIPLSAPHVPYAQVDLSSTQTLQLYVPTLSGFIENVTGSAFGTEIRTFSQAVLQIPAAASRFAIELSYPILILGLLGFLWLARRAMSLAALTGVSFLVSLVFNLFYGIGDIYVYYIPVFLLWIMWAGVGVIAVGEVCAELVRRLGPSTAEKGHIDAFAHDGWLSLGAAVLALAIPCVMGVHRFAAMDQSRNDAARAGWERVLSQPIPENALLVSNDRDEMTPLWYLQYVEGVRTDLIGLFPRIVPGSDWGNIGQVVATALSSGRPVILIKEMPGMEVKYELEALGDLVQVTGQAVDRAPDRPADATFGDSIRLVGYDVYPAQPEAGGSLRITLYWKPLRELPEDFTTFVHLVDGAGGVVGRSDHLPGGVYYPSSLWRPGELIEDVHQFTLASTIGAPPYEIEVGLYTHQGELRNLGSPQRIGDLGMARDPDVVPGDLTHPLDRVFGDQFALRGYESALADHLLTLRVYWQAVRQPDARYARFVHVLDGSGAIIVQDDETLGRGKGPTDTWPHGYVFADEVQLSLPEDLAAGTYRVDIGLYDANTGDRLPSNGNDSELTGDSVTLMELCWPPQ